MYTSNHTCTVDKENPAADSLEDNCVKRSVRNLFRNTKIFVHVLVCVFAIASWVDINGMWAELPLLVEKAKEGWSLPSYIIVISQIANVGPLLFVVISCLAPQTKPKLEKVTSFIIILVGVVACLLLAFLWEYTTYVGGSEHSTSLLALNFFLAVGDCTSSVSFYAFMAHMKPEYMASLFIGEGLSGLIPAMIALGQGAGEIQCNGTQAISTEPNFSVRVYFIILSAIIVVSAIAFFLLNFWSYCRSEMIQQTSDNIETIIDQVKQSTTMYGTLESQDIDSRRNLSSEYSRDAGYNGPYVMEDEEKAISIPQNRAITTETPIIMETHTESSPGIHAHQFTSHHVHVPEIPLWKFFLILALIILINMTLTTFLSSIQIFSVLPYGLEYYHLTTTLPQIANPVACCFALFVMAEHTAIILVVTLLGQCCVGYIIYAAAMSPTPPFLGDSGGGEIAVTVWVLVTLLLTYAKVSLAGVLRKQGRNALIWGGASTQVGALIGAVVGFVLVNTYKLFQDAPYCT